MLHAIPDAMLEPVAARFRVLGDATRLAILRLLLTTGEMSVGEVVERLAMSQANVSKHLRVLHDARIVSRTARGTAAYYAVADPSIAELCELVCERLRTLVADDVLAYANTGS